MSNPLVDQRALASGAALCRVPAAVVRVTGTDRHTVLDNLLSQKIRPIAPGESREALVLTGEGRIVRVVHLVEADDATIVIAPDAESGEVADWLESRVFLEDMHAEALAEVAVVTGVAASAPVSALHTWVDPWGALQPGGYQYAEGATDRTWAVAEWVVPATALAELALVPYETLDALRIEAGRPALADVDNTALPHEFDWLRSAVHLNKGCYPGQETVAKVHNVGHPPRRLVRLHLDGSESVFAEAGDAVELEGAVVGRITTAAIHHELGPIALALVKRTAPVSATLTVIHDDSALPATQDVIVPPDAGATAGVPRLPTLR